jgi:hypothetical protein
MIDWEKLAMPAEITNKQLAEAISDKNGEDPRAHRRIQALLRDFCPWGAAYYTAIPQARRWEFLGRLTPKRRITQKRA